MHLYYAELNQTLINTWQAASVLMQGLNTLLLSNTIPVTVLSLQSAMLNTHS